jgi:hypothetical protein
MITIVMPYYENPKMLRLQMHEWRMYRPAEKEALCALIVDDGSPRNPARDVAIAYAGAAGFPIRVLRINENIPWNQDGARNLAMKNVLTNWVLMTDMDHMIQRDQVSAMLDFTSHKVTRGEYYMPRRVDFDGRSNHPHANSYVFNVSDFWAMGGYDEDFAGTYGSDGNFRKCARAVLRERITDAFHLTRWPRDAISDANTTDWGRKDSEYHRSRFPKLEAKSRGPAYKAVAPIRFTWEQVY